MALQKVILGNIEFTMQDANTMRGEIVKEGFRKATPEHNEWESTSLLLSSWSILVLCVAYTVDVKAVGELNADEKTLVDFWDSVPVNRHEYESIWNNALDTLTPDLFNVWYEAYTRTRPHAIIAPDVLSVSEDEAQKQGADFLADGA